MFKKKPSIFNPSFKQISDGILIFKRMYKNIDFQNKEQLSIIYNYGTQIIKWDLNNPDKEHYSLDEWMTITFILFYIESKLEKK